MKATNITWHQLSITKDDRSKHLEQKPCILWFTGLSGSGKSTIANALEVALFHKGIKTYLLDGDNVRHGLNKDLGFSEFDRVENIRRIGEMAKLFVDAGLIVLSAFISPFTKDRALVKDLVCDGEFIEIFIDTPFDICAKRDPKGLYKKALEGKIKNFTGLDSPYEKPENPEVHIYTQDESVDESVAKIIGLLKEKKYIH